VVPFEFVVWLECAVCEELGEFVVGEGEPVTETTPVDTTAVGWEVAEDGSEVVDEGIPVKDPVPEEGVPVVEDPWPLAAVVEDPWPLGAVVEDGLIAVVEDGLTDVVDDGAAVVESLAPVVDVQRWLLQDWPSPVVGWVIW